MTRKHSGTASEFDVTPPASVDARIEKAQRERSPPAVLTVYDPIKPVIDERSILRHIYQRAYAEPVGRKSWKPRKERPLPTLDGIVACLDIETIKHILTFGVCEIFERRKLRERCVFYRDDLPTVDPEGFARLRSICIAVDLPLRSREWLFQNVIWPARKHGWTICGYNPIYDLSHLSDSFEPATKTARQGARFCNGFAFKKRLTNGDEPVFLRVKRDDRHHVRYDMKRAVVLDLAAPVFAHTDRNHSLATACHAFGISFDERPGKHSGEITRENVEGCLYDVRKTSELLWAVDAEHAKLPVTLPLSRASTGASINKACQGSMGVQPRLQAQPDFPKEYCGFAARAYAGGWVEADGIKTVLPCVYSDILSAYPGCVALGGLWFEHVIPATLDVQEIEPSQIEALLAELRERPDDLFDRAIWKRLGFFALVDPNDATLPARAVIDDAGVTQRDALADRQSRASHTNVTIGPVRSHCPLWVAGPDLAAAAINGGALKVVRAWRLQGRGLQETLRPIRLRGFDFDPRIDDFPKRLIELRKASTDDELDDRRRNTGYKVIANSIYGMMAETNPVDIDPDDEDRAMRPVRVYADRTYETSVDRPERPGRFSFFPTASLITSFTRLLIALGKHLVERAGGFVCYVDTDSLCICASRDGGFVPCEFGPYVLPDGRRAVRALSWAQVEAIRERFTALNPYDQSIENVRGSILKLEDENFVDKARTERCELFVYPIAPKVYALFILDERGEPVIRKCSQHVLGQYRSPIPGDNDPDRRDHRHDWIKAAFVREIRAALGKPAEAFEWERYPAISPLTMTTWSVFKPYRENKELRPFDFLAVGIVNDSHNPVYRAIEEMRHSQSCCKSPRPACALFGDLSKWREQDWRCLRCGESWNFDLRPRLKTYGDVIRHTIQGVARKRLCADGSEPTRESRGLTIPRPVHVETVTPIGKEIIVDPTDTDEEFTAEMLNATAVLEYRDPDEDLEALRSAVREIGVKPVAREIGMSDRRLRAFVNKGVHPHGSTIDKLVSALRKTRRRS